ncbi:uncharacterized protein LTR77_010091 [Saxophila tyrrhenica]|uniref:AB hydrolase-1 domain-containing protein n=1 Tax=Saxophila tyrrhenica TaxID=1690608 RepID=A0AAV9NXE3_9PEZI|nr:hypothetical protein LTR77_010091 [Saxophila tyrrhenica]
MLIGKSLPEYLLIRTAIPALRLIAPLAIVACPVILIARPQAVTQHRWLWAVGVWLIAEAGFFWAVYVPRRLALQKPVTHPAPPSKEKREELVERSHSALSDPEHYLSKWFLNAPLTEIKRENVKEFYAWSFMNKRYEDVSPDEDAELDGYIDQLERKMGRSLGGGKGSAKPLRTTVDPVPMQHRPLVWYLIVLLVESGCALQLRYNGFRFYTSSAVRTRLTFPLGLHSLSRDTSASSRIGYWYREHTSKSKKPVLFVHGIGIGFYTYCTFLTELNSTHSDDGAIGIIAIELTSISSRICAAGPSAAEVKDEIGKILDRHGWDEVVLAGHS